jgi:superfamily I DNA/RNA helicase
LIGNQPRLAERVEVHSIDSIGERLYEVHFSSPNLASIALIQRLLAEAAEQANGVPFSSRFLLSEWQDVVDAWQLTSWEEYRDVLRLGRKTRLPERRRAELWTIFERVRGRLKSEELITYSEMFSLLAGKLVSRKHPPFEFAVVDEAQDISIAQLKFLSALDKQRPNSLFFTGDLGQRIFQAPFSWKALGVDVRGRSRTLRINYRTSHQIRIQADRLLAPEVSDVDGNTQDRRDTVSVFNGPEPMVRTFESDVAECKAIAAWLAERQQDGLVPHEIGVFVRSRAQLDRAQAALKTAELTFKVLDEKIAPTSGHVSVSTMHLAKGLEFRAVAVMACDDEIVPLLERIETVSDDTDLEEVYNTERHLLYVACTRARDYLLVTGIKPGSEFLDDFQR